MTQNRSQKCEVTKTDRNIVIFVYNMILTSEGLGLSVGYHFLHTGLSSPVGRFHSYLHSVIGPDHFRPEKNKEIRKNLIFPSSTE